MIFLSIYLFYFSYLLCLHSRSELQSTNSLQKRFDGIIRICPPDTGLDVGFIEHKSWDKKCSGDRSKVINEMVTALESIRCAVTDMANITVHGIYCQGVVRLFFIRISLAKGGGLRYRDYSFTGMLC